ncbi:hypothetical protein K0M31_014016 [Melipona bicolor]|uniref:Uncharacterized protein n=1 Tax=Melipona bicolor TaxID=60889 RepID=A0AA40KTW1_9HYME|nr:hypothetical protein K0M31_014016 [Melipona bicolor]
MTWDLEINTLREYQTEKFPNSTEREDTLASLRKKKRTKTPVPRVFDCETHVWPVDKGDTALIVHLNIRAIAFRDIWPISNTRFPEEQRAEKVPCVVPGLSALCIVRSVFPLFLVGFITLHSNDPITTVRRIKVSYHIDLLDPEECLNRRETDYKVIKCWRTGKFHILWKAST